MGWWWWLAIGVVGGLGCHGVCHSIFEALWVIPVISGLGRVCILMCFS